MVRGGLGAFRALAHPTVLRRVRGTPSLLLRTHTFPIYLSNSQASSPVFFGRRRVRRRLIPIPASPGIRITAARPEKKPRARGTPRGPRDPRASTPRDIEACRSPLLVPQVRQIPRRPARGVYRLAPRRPRWSYRSSRSPENLTVGHLTTVEAQTVGRRVSDNCTGLSAVRGLGAAAGHARTMRLGPPGAAPHLRCNVFPGHRSPPRVWRR